MEGLEGAFAANEGETESGNFAGIDIDAGKQGGDLRGRVAIFYRVDYGASIVFRQQWLDGRDELGGIDEGERVHVGVLYAGEGGGFQIKAWSGIIGEAVENGEPRPSGTGLK